MSLSTSVFSFSTHVCLQSVNNKCMCLCLPFFRVHVYLCPPLCVRVFYVQKVNMCVSDCLPDPVFGGRTALPPFLRPLSDVIRPGDSTCWGESRPPGGP